MRLEVCETNTATGLLRLRFTVPPATLVRRIHDDDLGSSYELETSEEVGFEVTLDAGGLLALAVRASKVHGAYAKEGPVKVRRRDIPMRRRVQPPVELCSICRGEHGREVVHACE